MFLFSRSGENPFCHFHFSNFTSFFHVQCNTNYKFICATPQQSQSKLLPLQKVIKQQNLSLFIRTIVTVQCNGPIMGP